MKPPKFQGRGFISYQIKLIYWRDFKHLWLILLLFQGHIFN